ncbi:MAG: cobalamin biosynthesis bifunctional protein CbiET, partial [Planctomycetes bacterium]|nr:cobalamin biosynthesis bifunctional protein CbiET [Planctomycetota bacterium]
MAQPEKIQIIGIGDDGLEGLTRAARQLVEQADLVIGAQQALDRVPR